MRDLPAHYIIHPDLDGTIDEVIAWMAERHGCICRWRDAMEVVLLIYRGEELLGHVLAERFAGWQDSDEGFDLLDMMIRRITCGPQTKGSVP